jgi:hypothetical protein
MFFSLRGLVFSLIFYFKVVSMGSILHFLCSYFFNLFSFNYLYFFSRRGSRDFSKYFYFKKCLCFLVYVGWCFLLFFILKLFLWVRFFTSL